MPGLNAGDVYVVVGAHIDTAAFTRADAAMRQTLAASNGYQAAITKGEAASKRLADANAKVASVAKTAFKVSAIGAAGFAVALGGAVVRAAQFDAAMRNVNSIGGLNEKQFKRLEKQILALGPAVGKTPQDLAEGLYNIVSSGFKATSQIGKTSDAYKILAASGKAARAGLTDTLTASTAIDAVLNSYGLNASHAKEVSDKLFQTVNVGVLNFQQLAGAIGKILPQAGPLGVSLNDLLGGLAALTLQGNTADEAATQLGQTMKELTKPSKELQKELDSLGFKSGQDAIKKLGFKGVLDAIEKDVKGSQSKIADLFHDRRAIRGFVGLEGTKHDVELFTSSVKAMVDATKGAGETERVFQEQQKSTSFQFDKLKATVDVAAVTIGSALLPMVNKGIGALTKWFQAAQKSGAIDRWAKDISDGVSAIVKEIHNLEPAAQKAFGVIASTIQAAIPFVKELYDIFQKIEPVVADVVKTAGNLIGVLGPGPILGAVGAFKALQTAGLGAQAGIGKFAKVMQAGSLAIAGATKGGVVAGDITKIGAQAVGSSSKLTIFARGLGKTLGNPNLIAAGAAGIVVSILYIRSTMTSLKDEAQDVVDALAELQGSRIDLGAAKIAKARADARLDSATRTAGSRAVDLARANAADPRPGALRAAAPTPAEIKATNDLAAANLNVRDAANQRDRAEAVLAAAEGKRADAQAKLSQQLVGLGQKSVAQARLDASNRRTAEIQQGRAITPAENAKEQADEVEGLVKSLRDAASASKTLDAAGKGAANRVADVVASLKSVPTDKQFKIIANDVAAGKSLAKIKKDLGIIDSTTATPTITADPSGANHDIDNITGKINALDALRPKVHIGGSGFDGVQAAIESVNQNILHITSNPFTVKINYAVGSKPKIDPHASGHKTKRGQAELAIIGEGSEPEYVIPTEKKHRAAGIGLWMAAGRDLGVKGYAAGKGPKKVPLSHFAKFPLDHYKADNDNKQHALGNEQHHYSNLVKKQQGIEKDIASARRKVARAKTATKSERATKKQYQKDLELLLAKSKPQLDALLNQELASSTLVQEKFRPEYQEANRRYKAALGFDNSIKKDQDDVSNAEGAMRLASDRWGVASAAFKAAKTPAAKKAAQAEMAKQLGAYNVASKQAHTANTALESLLTQAQGVINDKSAYWRQIHGQIISAQDADVGDTDPTATPGYEDPEDPASPSSDINDYLNPFELTELQQVAYGQAVASTTDDLNDDVAADQVAYGVAQQIADRLTRDGAPIDILTQAIQAVASAKSDLASSIDAAKPEAPTQTQDQTDQLAQAKTRADQSDANARSAEQALGVFQGSRELFGPTPSATVNVYTLTPGNPVMQRQIGEQVAAAFGSQPSVSGSQGTYNG